MTPRIPPLAHCRGRGPPWQMDINFRLTPPFTYQGEFGMLCDTDSKPMVCFQCQILTWWVHHVTFAGPETLHLTNFGIFGAFLPTLFTDPVEIKGATVTKPTVCCTTSNFMLIGPTSCRHCRRWDWLQISRNLINSCWSYTNSLHWSRWLARLNLRYAVLYRWNLDDHLKTMNTQSQRFVCNLQPRYKIAVKVQ